MPSSTFFNLPQAKRERLLQAAREEFARVPYDQASINKIIQGAGIPRGSFYMYFTDKEELFQYMTEEFLQTMFKLLEQLLKESEGDPFQAFMALYDYVARYEPCGGVEQLMQIFRHNAGAQQGALLASARLAAHVEELEDYVDWRRLSVRQESDKCDMLRILFVITAPALGGAVLESNGPEKRERYRAQLDILKRGMQAPQRRDMAPPAAGPQLR